VFQLVAIAATVVAGIGAVVLILIGVPLSIVVVGVPIIILGVILGVVSAVIPLAALVYGVVAAFQAYDNPRFRYWLIGDRMVTR
jgi:uncharacterized Tic20 family protein